MTRCGFEASIPALFIKSGAAVALTHCQRAAGKLTSHTLKLRKTRTEAHNCTPENHSGFWEGCNRFWAALLWRRGFRKWGFASGLAGGQQQVWQMEVPAVVLGLTRRTQKHFPGVTTAHVARRFTESRTRFSSAWASIIKSGKQSKSLVHGSFYSERFYIHSVEKKKYIRIYIFKIM